MIDPAERRALVELRRLDWAPTPDDVWTALEVHIDELNGTAGEAVLRVFADAGKSRGSSPLGLVVQGQHGSGKTHLLRWAREQVQRQHGYFFLMGMSGSGKFWPDIVHMFLRGLRSSGSYRHIQLSVLLDRLSERAGISSALRRQIRGQSRLSPDAVDAFVAALRRVEPEIGRECRFTARALVLLASDDDDVADLGDAWLLSLPDQDQTELTRWGLPARSKPAVQVASEISRLLACTGPTLLAVDQIDVIFAQARRTPDDPAGVAEGLGNGLMDLREKLRRTVTVIACLPTSWDLIRDNAVESTEDRFRQETRLSRLPSPEIAERLVSLRFSPLFETVGFKPPYPTWPVLPGAFATAPDHTPRSLMQRVDQHIQHCLSQNEIVALADLDDVVAVPPEPVALTPEQIAPMLARFTQLRESADVTAALTPRTEDREMCRLLGAGLRAWVVEQGDRRSRFHAHVGEEGSPSVHAWLRESLDEETEDEEQWSFRALCQPHHRAVQTRLERFRQFVKPDPAIGKRHAVLLRNVRWPNGPVSRRMREEFQQLGGVILEVPEDDLRTFAALAALLDENDPALPDFLLSYRPAGRTTVLTTVMGPPDGRPARDVQRAVDARPIPRQESAADRAPGLTIGTVTGDGREVRLPLAGLRKHSVIFAGSGSGKTVLIRRIIEECALQGVSAIVLDPNNDLARLGDAWPDPPDGWRDGDPQRAEDYLAGTDVVVWTPRRSAGRPLTLEPLPDFAAVLDEPDEFGMALDAAVATLAPRARMAANTSKADRGRAVLKNALEHFGRDGGGTLAAFVELLADLPDEATGLARARELAADMAETLKAAMVNDPLFGGEGTPLDPGLLLTPAPGRRARVSVISLIGLPGREQPQSFVNQLQMALFAWIKQHPANDRPLGGLFVMDEAQNFAPSSGSTACTESTLALASQARKYGLGLIFATQAPKGIHNRIVGNAATQFYGFLNSPTQIAAANEVARAKGSFVMDISRLKAGQFYAVTEGAPFRKVTTSMCLTHHPSSALTAEEVIARAGRQGEPDGHRHREPGQEVPGGS